MTDIAPRTPMLHDFVRFGVAGAVGFVVDVCVLLLFVTGLDQPPLLARVFSFAAALLTTWTINRLWTFRRRTRGKSRRDVSRELARYGAVALTAGAANYAVYAMLVVAAPSARPIYLLLAVIAGVAAGMVINFLGARSFVFPRRKQTRTAGTTEQVRAFNHVDGRHPLQVPGDAELPRDPRAEGQGGEAERPLVRHPEA